MEEFIKPRPNNVKELEKDFGEGAISREYERIAQEYLDENPILDQVIKYNKEEYGSETIREILAEIRKDKDFLERLDVQSKKDVGDQLKDTREAIISAAPGNKVIAEAENPLAEIIKNFEFEKSGKKTRSREELNISDLISQRLTGIETIRDFLRAGEERGMFDGEKGKEIKKKREDILKDEEEKLAAVLVAIKRAA